jgi:hypothetical protein
MFMVAMFTMHMFVGFMFGRGFGLGHGRLSKREPRRIWVRK